MVYIGCFGLSALLAHWSTQLSWERHKRMIIVLSFFSILIPSVLAGVRDTSIGTDVEYYLTKWFSIARYTQDFSQYMRLSKEPFFLVLIFITTKIFDDIHWVMFFIQFIIVACVYVGAFRHRTQMSMPLVLLLFYFLFYNDSYNVLRQYMALAVVFLGISFLEERKYKIYLIHVIVATMFHYTAIFAILLVVVKELTGSERFARKKLINFLFIIFICLSCLLFDKLVTILVSLGILDVRYFMYVSKDSVSNNNLATLIYLAEVIAIYWLQSNGKKIGNDNFFSMVSVLNLIILQLTRTIYHGDRISLYFAFINILGIAMIPKVYKNKKTYIIITVLITIIALGYWWYLYVLGNVSNTYPYTSVILGI